jgi:NADP-reducing hydrogenase subunit HndB
MPKITSLADLQQLRQQLQQDIKARTDATTTITVGMGTCGIAAGAREVMHGNVDPTMVPRLIEEHVVQGRVVDDWVVGRVAG